MAGELRDFYDAGVVRSIAADLKGAYPTFNSRAFITECLTGLDPLSLTGRAAHIAAAMHRHLPADFTRAAQVLQQSLGPPHAGTDTFGMAPFKYLPHTMFIASHGLGHFDASMRLQYEITQRFTAEFSIRAFLNAHPDATYARLVAWSEDPNPHVRRLVSEGTRPRLPWAPRLRHFQQDPAPVLALLERLKDDPALYVRRSVANNLNDIAKDHPDLIVEVCRRWLDTPTADRQWIVTHALRSLVKAGHRGALSLLGAGRAPHVRVERIRISPRRVRKGGRIECGFSLCSTARSTQDLLVDFIVHYVKADGRTSPKVFKLTRLSLDRGASVPLRLRVATADLTTRKHYPGRHRLELQVNGRTYDLGQFQLMR